jgi:hypothetical protein
MTSDDRPSIERRIVDLASEVPVDSHDPNWVMGQDLRDFQSSWYDLEKYYEMHDDTFIGPEVMSEFIRIERSLRYIACNCSQPAQIRESATEQLGILELAVQQTLWEAINSLNFDDRDQSQPNG